MAYAKINSVTNANMAKVSSVAKAAIGKIGSIDAPSAGATFADAKSLDFDGTDDFVLTGLEFVNRNVTISCWLKRDTSNYFEAIFGDMSSDRTNTLWFNTYFSGGFWIHIGDGSAFYNVTTTGVNIADGNWHHVVFRIGGDDASDNNIDPKVWVDGVLKLDATEETDKNSATVEFGVGTTSHGTSGGSFEGNINDVAVWQKQLTTAEVVEIYNSGDPTDLRVDTGNYASADDLIGYWWMGDGDTYPTITDHSDEGNDGTMTNMTSGDLVEDVP